MSERPTRESIMPITATVSQFKVISGLGKTKIFKMIRTGEIQSVFVSGTRLIVLQSYRDLLEKQLQSEVRETGLSRTRTYHRTHHPAAV